LRFWRKKAGNQDWNENQVLGFHIYFLRFCLNGFVSLSFGLFSDWIAFTEGSEENEDSHLSWIELPFVSFC